MTLKFSLLSLLILFGFGKVYSAAFAGTKDDSVAHSSSSQSTQEHFSLYEMFDAPTKSNLSYDQFCTALNVRSAPLTEAQLEDIIWFSRGDVSKLLHYIGCLPEKLDTRFKLFAPGHKVHIFKTDQVLEEDPHECTISYAMCIDGNDIPRLEELTAAQCRKVREIGNSQADYISILLNISSDELSKVILLYDACTDKGKVEAVLSNFLTPQRESTMRTHSFFVKETDDSLPNLLSDYFCEPRPTDDSEAYEQFLAVLFQVCLSPENVERLFQGIE
ncbi:MAG: hypothetical protein WCJ92_05390 [Alphaproteobacteria bacterium]